MSHFKDHLVNFITSLHKMLLHFSEYVNICFVKCLLDFHIITLLHSSETYSNLKFSYFIFHTFVLIFLEFIWSNRMIYIFMMFACTKCDWINSNKHVYAYISFISSNLFEWIKMADIAHKNVAFMLTGLKKKYFQHLLHII